ncbi:MAG: sister chromatid cohesion 1 4 [Trebouxia sp. A1-2]|nr:MAG: sister chromatid cohesion 1 4 [Trebouxia sp. A1-2]
MFYSVQLLAKKGPLGTVWIAGHLDKRLKRNQIYETNISSSVDSIINPEAPLALRLSGQLLLGVVRIYSRKINYLYSDCNEALVKIKQAFKAGDVDLPTEGIIAPMHAITLPDNFNNLDFGLNGPSFTLEMDDEDGPVTVSYGRRESFVLADDMSDFFGTQRSIDEEQFEAGGEELRRHFSMDGGLEPEKLRAAPAAEAQRQGPDPLFSGDSGVGPPPDDDMLAPPPDDLMFGLEEGIPVAPPSEPAAGPSPAQSDGLQALADLGNMSTPGGSIRAASPELQEEERAATKPPRPARQALKLSKKRRPACLDIASNKPNTELPKAEIMSLLKDPSSLVQVRDSISTLQGNKQIQNSFHVASYSELAQESLLHRPAVSANMAPQLYSLYQTAMTSKQDLAQQRLQATAAERSFWPDATQEATAAAVAADEMAAAEAAEPEAALNGGDALDFGGPVDMAGVHDDRMDASAGAAQPGFSDQGFGAGGDMTIGDDRYEGLSPAGPAEDAQDGMATATPPLTDGHSIPEEVGSQGTELKSVGGDAHTKDSFTSRTKMVLSSLQTNFEAAAEPGSVKKRRLSSNSSHGSAPQVSMNALVEGKGRKDASRWFFEMLVLKTRNYVNLKQEEPYSDISISATSKLLTAT